MGQVVRADAGPVIIQMSEFGADPTLPAATIYTSTKWSFTPGTTITKLSGPRGTPITAIPFVGEQVIELEWMGEAVASIEASRLLGKSTFTGETAANAIELLSGFATGGGLKDRADLATALAAIGGGALAGAAVPTVYEIRMVLTDAAAPAATGSLYRITPIPTLIADTTDVFDTALIAADFASFFEAGAGTDTDTAVVVFNVSGPTRGKVELTWDNPTIPRTKILAMSGRETGNAFSYLEADNCIAEEGTYGFERGAVSAIPTKFTVLGATARLVQIDYQQALAAVDGIA